MRTSALDSSMHTERNESRHSSYFINSAVFLISLKTRYRQLSARAAGAFLSHRYLCYCKNCFITVESFIARIFTRTRKGYFFCFYKIFVLSREMPCAAVLLKIIILWFLMSSSAFNLCVHQVLNFNYSEMYLQLQWNQYNRN